MSQSHAPRKSGEKRCRCGESRPEPMTRRGGPPCYECRRAAQGCKRTENHHPFGRDNPNVQKITVEIPGNWHRSFDVRRALRPEILKRPGENPLHRIAAVVATLGEAAEAVADFARREQWPEWTAALADRFSSAAHSAAEWLLILAAQLDDRLGPEWASDLGMPSWTL